MAYCGKHGIALSDFLNWSPQDQEAALEWADLENRRCKQCGTHPEEWEEDKFAFHAHLVECKGCRQRERLAASDEAKREGEGVYAVMAGGPAAECPRCQPLPVV